jgi:hypothetical protein
MESEYQLTWAREGSMLVESKSRHQSHCQTICFLTLLFNGTDFSATSKKIRAGFIDEGVINTDDSLPASATEFSGGTASSPENFHLMDLPAFRTPAGDVSLFEKANVFHLIIIATSIESTNLILFP